MMINYTSNDGPGAHYLTVYSVQKPLEHTKLHVHNLSSDNGSNVQNNYYLMDNQLRQPNSQGQIQTQIQEQQHQASCETIPDHKIIFTYSFRKWIWNVLQNILLIVSIVLLLIAFGMQIFLPISSLAANKEISTENHHLFQANKDLSKLLFEVNREMFYVVEHLLQTNHNFSQLEFTWQMTDAAVMSAGKTSALFLPSVSGAFELFKYRLSSYRKHFSYTDTANPLEVIKSYLELAEYIDHSCLSLGTPVHNPYLKHRHPISTIGFALLSRGIGRRIAQMAYVSVYLKSNITSIKLSSFFELHHTSKESLALAFELLPAAKLKYHELQARMPDMSSAMEQLGEDMTSCSRRRQDPDLLRLFQSSINDELSLLLQTKEFYSNTLGYHINKYRNENKNKDYTRVIITISSVLLASILMLTIYVRMRTKRPSSLSSTQ